jgi:hypothetical protein
MAFSKPYRRLGHATRTLVWCGRLLHVVSARRSSFPQSPSLLPLHGLAEHPLESGAGAAVAVEAVCSASPHPAGQVMTRATNTCSQTSSFPEKDGLVDPSPHPPPLPQHRPGHAYGMASCIRQLPVRLATSTSADSCVLQRPGSQRRGPTCASARCYMRSGCIEVHAVTRVWGRASQCRPHDRLALSGGMFDRRLSYISTLARYMGNGPIIPPHIPLTLILVHTVHAAHRGFIFPFLAHNARNPKLQDSMSLLTCLALDHDHASSPPPSCLCATSLGLVSR